MRVLQLINRFDFGGAENHVRELCNELTHQNIDVFLATQCGRQKALLDQRVKFIKTSRLTQYFLLPRVAAIAFIIIKHRIDIVHAHQRLPIISACLAGFLLRVPVVATVHGRVRHDLRSYFARQMASKIVFVSKRVLTISRYYKQLLAKSVIIPNGIPLPKRKPKIVPLAIGYICRMDARHAKAIELLATAIERLKKDHPAITLTIYGDGKMFGHVNELADGANSRMGSPTIFIKGYSNVLDEERLPELVVGTGRVAIEALVLGSCVLPVNFKRTGDTVTLSNYNSYAANNFVEVNGEPPTANALYLKIKSYLRNRQRHRGESAELQKRAANDFCIHQTTDRIVELYYSLIQMKT